MGEGMDGRWDVMDALDAWALWTLGKLGGMEGGRGEGMDERHRVKKPVPNTQSPIPSTQ
jgi:hypothetical protein